MENNYGGGGREDLKLLVPKLLVQELFSQSSEGEFVQDGGHRGVADADCPCGEKQEPRSLSQGQTTRMNGQQEVFGVASEGGGRGRRRDENRVTLNVGGQVFQTSIETMSFDPHSMLAAMVTLHMPSREDETIFINGDPENLAFFIDRDPVWFRHVLNYLRTQTIWLDNLSDLRAVQEEAHFFCLGGLYDFCDELIDDQMLRLQNEMFEADMVLKEPLKIITEDLEWIKMVLKIRNQIKSRVGVF